MGSGSDCAQMSSRLTANQCLLALHQEQQAELSSYHKDLAGSGGTDQEYGSLHHKENVLFSFLVAQPSAGA